MAIISVRDNENSRWKRSAKNNNNNAKKKKRNKDTKEQGRTEVIVKVSGLNDFVVHLI